MMRATMQRAGWLGAMAILALSAPPATAQVHFRLPDWITPSGLLELESAYGISTGAAQKTELSFRPRVDMRLPGGATLTGIARLRGDAYDHLDPGSHVKFDLRELYVDLTVGGAYLRLGKQQVVWGQTDGLKLLDVLNPQDFREFILDSFEDSRIPLWTMNLEIPVRDFVVQLLWIPDRTYHKIPEDGAVFGFTAPLFRPVIPRGVAVELRETEKPDRLIADSDFGVKVSTFWKGWDLGVNYAYLYDDVPVLFRRVSLDDAGPRVTITPRYARTHLVGGTFSNTFGALTLRGEVAYQSKRYFITSTPQDDDGVLGRGEAMYALGFDWFGLSDWTLSAQVFQSVLTGSASTLPRDRLQTNVTGLVRRDLQNDRLTAEILWIQNVNQGDGVVRPKVRYELRSNTNVWLGADLFYGSGEGLFGQFDHGARVVTGVELGL
ncbi:MAG: hypothetical protein O7I93_05985 [Gemmatimonadetes bacterium]|nr:hypothetical protein [Gemmatimonadota bacterium]